MNKLATISLVTVLGVAGGGAYLAMNPEVADEYAQYLPEPVTGLMNEYLPDDFKPAFLTKNNTNNAVMESDQQMAQDSQMDSNEGDDMLLDDNLGQDQAQNSPEETVENTEGNVDNMTGQVNAQDNINESLEEIQDELGKELTADSMEQAPATAEVKAPTSNNPKAAKIEKKINGINAEISKLDSENEQLKERFQNILKKNRELAEQLKEIDEKLTANN